MKSDQIPSLCGGLFHTSKRGVQSASIGKYGIGIKAILLYYNTKLTVSSSTVEDSIISTYQLQLEDAAIQVLNSKSTPKPDGMEHTLSGSRIAIDHIRGEISTAYAFLSS